MTSAQQTATASLRVHTSVGVDTAIRVDTEILDGAAGSLLAPSAECARLAEDLLGHAPDPGPQRAVDLLGELLEGAVDSLTALAASLARSSRDLYAAADGYREHERTVRQAADRAAAVLDGA